MRTLIQILGWVEHCERDHGGCSMWPTWLASTWAFHDAFKEGYIAEIGKRPLIPREGTSLVLYGLTDKGRQEFYAALPSPDKLKQELERQERELEQPISPERRRALQEAIDRNRGKIRAIERPH
jgi:DNA-binding PadR family transcriptional regulator